MVVAAPARAGSSEAPRTAVRGLSSSAMKSAAAVVLLARSGSRGISIIAGASRSSLPVQVALHVFPGFSGLGHLVPTAVVVAFPAAAGVFVDVVIVASVEVAAAGGGDGAMGAVSAFGPLTG